MVKSPQEWLRLKRDPGLLQNAVEEMPRLRYAHLERHPLHAGSDVGRRLRSAAADRGHAPLRRREPHSEVFAEPELRFDIGRPNARKHLAFARGDHFCLGASLARLQLEVVFGRLGGPGSGPSGRRPSIRCRPTVHPRGLLPFTVAVEPE